MTAGKNKEESSSKEEKNKDNDEEVAIALVAECHVGEKKFKAGETWTDPKHDCRMSICNPGGVISYLECPHFELEEGDEIRIPGDSKYAYPHCCDYVFRTKKKTQEDTEEEKAGGKGKIITEEGEEKIEDESRKDEREKDEGRAVKDNEEERKNDDKGENEKGEKVEVGKDNGVKYNGVNE